MRLLILFLFVSGICHGQSLLNKEVNLNRKSGTVGEFLNDLNKIPGIVLSYSSGLTDLNKTIELKGAERTVEDYLKSILKGQPVKYLEENGKIFLVADKNLKKKFTVSGYITDKLSGERLIGASVYIPEKFLGTTSNTYGFFSLTLDEELLNLQISYTGFRTYITELKLDADKVLAVEMEQNIIPNKLVVINAEGKRNNQSRSIGKIDVPVSLIKSLPAMLGEADVMKTLQLLPGVQAGNEGSSGLHVRGGSVDQNLILLDGVPVYNASHAFGVFSVFNPDAVFNVEILKSGFPASYGGRLSSVIDVHLKEGDKYKVHGEGGIGIIFSKLTIEGPIREEKSSFLISGRRTYADLFIRPILKISKDPSDVKPFFSDLNLKANFPLGEKDRFYLSLYLGKDNFHSLTKYQTEFSPDTFYIKNSYGFSWGNITAMARWNHEFTQQTFANFTFTHSRYDFKSEQLEEHKSTFQVNPLTAKQNYTSGIQDWNVRGDIDYLPAPNHFMKTGFTATLHRYQPGISRYLQRDTAIKIDKEIRNETLYAGEYDLYVEDDIRISGKSKLNLGLRFSAFEVKGKVFTAIQPRINWLYKIDDRWQLKASGGKMNQFIHLLTNSNLGLPTDLWLPVTKRVPPQSSNQLAVGITYRHDRSLEASMEVYYKSMNHVIDYTEGSGFGNAFDNWEDMVASGKGKSYGVEWLLQKKKGTLTGLLSYTLGRSQRTFEHINDGKAFPYKYDKRHEVKLAAVWNPVKKFELGANWIFSSGNAISLPVGFYLDPVSNVYVDIYTARNNYRMPSYHRLDVSLKFMKQKKKHLRTWVFSIYNVYNRFNPFFIYKAQENNRMIYKEVSVLPFLPSFSYQFKF